MTGIPRDPSTARDPASLLVGAIAAQVIGGLVAQMSPFMIGGFMAGLSLSERDAGFVASVEFLTLAITSIAIAPVLPRLSYRRVGLVAVALALLAQGASIFSASLEALVLLRGLAGVGEGALCAVSLSFVASRCRNPDKVYGYFQVVWALGSVPLFAAGGELTAAHAHRGILALIAGVTLALAPLLLLIPDAHAKRDETATDTMQASPSLGLMTLAAIILNLTASAGIYAFIAPLGERAGLDTGAVGYAMTLSSLVGLAGAGAATALNVRWGRAVPNLGVQRRLHAGRARALPLARPDRLHHRPRRMGRLLLLLDPLSVRPRRRARPQRALGRRGGIGLSARLRCRPPGRRRRDRGGGLRRPRRGRRSPHGRRLGARHGRQSAPQRDGPRRDRPPMLRREAARRA